jgi:hypothetical protein
LGDNSRGDRYNGSSLHEVLRIMGNVQISILQPLWLKIQHFTELFKGSTYTFNN